MKNIVIDARMINHSGIGTYLRNVVTTLADYYSVTLLGSKDLFTAFPWFEKINIITCKSRIYSLAEQWKLPRKIPQCDLFLSPHYNIPLLPIRAKHRVVIIHDVYHLAYIKTLPVHQKLYAKLMINSAARMSESVITVSEFSKSEIIKYTGIQEQKIHIVYFGIDISNANNNADEELVESIKLKYLLPDKYLLFVGNLKPHKNLKNLLLAFKTVAGNNSQIKLVIVGKSDGLITRDNESIRLIENDDVLKNATVFTGYVDDEDLPLIYRYATSLVFPSFYEGSGLPPLEAMSYGCPVIASSAASIPEICGDAALYFNPSDCHELTDRMMKILEDENLRTDLIHKGLENIKRFSRDKFAENLKYVVDKTILN